MTKNNFLAKVLLLLIGFSLSVSAGYVNKGEKLTITIKGVPTSEQQAINGEYVVGDSGLLYMPMLTKGVSASGGSSSSLARRIEKAYRDAEIYNNPRITIITARDVIKGINDQKQSNRFITVAGHVKRPGPVQFTDGMTIYAAVAAAGDASTFGAMNRVELLRSGRKSRLDLKQTNNRTLKAKPGDVITVPQKNAFGR